MILGGVNFGMTFFGLYVVEKYGRRRSLIVGGIGMTVTFLVFASVGGFSLDYAMPMNTPKQGTVMIVFACLFIAFYAVTWGPIIWCIVGECKCCSVTYLTLPPLPFPTQANATHVLSTTQTVFPSQYRARSMALVTSSNWTWNFLIAFFTPFITSDIQFKYGYVFAGCNAAAVLIVYFFVCETQGRTLEEIDTMYLSKVKPWKSSSWVAPDVEDERLVDAQLYKSRDQPGVQQQELVE